MLIGRREESRIISFRAEQKREILTTAVGFEIEGEDVDPKEGGV
jgi:hypothetical protein